jgi:flagellar protein FliS
MSYAIASNAVRQYRQLKADVAVESATPHRLIQMLFEGALEHLASAKGHLRRRELARKGEAISKAISIIGCLQEGLNLEAGGVIAHNLDALYDYMQRRLLQANLASEPMLLDEVADLLREIKAGWDAIG